MSNTPIRILLIEDNAGDARLIREMLLTGGQEDVQLDPVTTLREGLARTADEAYDIILLDLSLPDSFGIDTLLKMQAEASDTAIVVLTGIDDQAVGIQAVQMGAQDYLAKGDVDSKLLMRAIRYAIERHRSEAALRRSEEEYRSLIDDVFDTSMVAVIILDKAFGVVWCNEATEVYFGIEREEILGRDKRRLIDDKLKCIFADPDDYSNRLLQAYAGSSFTDHFECHVLPGTNREERWLEHWSQPIRSGRYQGGRIEQYTDITDRKLLEFAEQEQRQFAEALRDIATLLTSTLDLNEVLGRILNSLHRVVPHDSAAITMLEDDHVWVARQNDNLRDTQEIVAERQFQVEYATLLGQMFDTQKSVIIGNLQNETLLKETATLARVRAYVGAPIQLQQKVIGFINVFSAEPHFFNETHAERLTVFAGQAAIAIQNARSYQQSQALAAMEERQRLARELHDSVNQTLFTCRTMAESALRRWDRDPAKAHELMQEVHDLTATALAEMRILLLELRPAALTQVGLQQLFEQYLRPIQNRRHFNLQLAIEEVAILPPEVQIALYRIAQEALNNIDKHAQAQEVQLSIRDYEDRLELQIIDDGQGFEVKSVSATSLGLDIMRERAASINASLDIESQIGVGTRVTIVWNKNGKSELENG